MITVDDMERSTVGVYGSRVEASTPNIDPLASEGLRFTNTHVNIAVRRPIADDVPILQESLTDPDALVNLVADPAYADVLAELRQQLANEMYRPADCQCRSVPETL